HPALPSFPTRRSSDLEAASAMPTTYVFPNRTESFSVLRRALDVNPQDATAHFLMGSLYLSAGETGPALEQWEAARRLKPAIPTLDRKSTRLNSSHQII